ncbi:beta-lactamase domain protein [Geobacter metallireducens RCH3]|uniref:Glyoxylase-related zinc-dependent hydrolase n=1 Tax=Geobacter metallireducens (strain ATCC 53774 / DSM 7210 / GS-15) TaxID=269799 RepID=Q39VH8_GEOMG|nr:MBL fold metallo-hydrolase [Geobacter metallireducens]ABB31746.1 glyoxylase-related zinc-dependent hydrolase [Geobacter metallireducens GS-15]EHP89376.1 beta-lactamase domain protein [Geobacter metallireducens RCH3]
MKRHFLLFPILVLMLATPALADLTKISDNVYSYVGATDASPTHSFAANAGIVIGRDGVLVVDTLLSAKEGERFLADIRKVTTKPIRYVVDTHIHLDHALGNCVFAREGATIISHEAERSSLAQNGAEILRKAGDYGLKPEDMVGTEIVLPSLTFSDRLTIDLGGETVELLRIAPSHTAGSTIVYLPAQKLLFSGDILFTDFHPFFADGDLPNWAKTLDAILAMDVERIVPGHGPLSTKKDLQEMKEYLRLFDAKARDLVATGKDVDTVAAQLAKVLPKRTLAEWMIPANLKARYLHKQ